MSRGHRNGSDFPDNRCRSRRVILFLQEADFVDEVARLDVKCVAETNVIGDPVYACEIGKLSEYGDYSVFLITTIPSTDRTFVTAYRSSTGTRAIGTTQTDKKTYNWLSTYSQKRYNETYDNTRETRPLTNKASECVRNARRRSHLMENRACRDTL